ncbi:SRPBCC domain-containing protein [Humidisolicoccus flavus]|uniref:SRPBCC domain-containing protein n=1 Tax=Humidisolicoccus flavus TaxID=3111414 RepID=UPI003249F363
MADATLETIDSRPALRFERSLPFPAQRVWRALAEPEQLGQWFPASIDWEPREGEQLSAFGMTGEVREVEAPKRLVWEFAGDLYSFDLAETAEGCRLVFVYVFTDRATAAQTAAGWDASFQRLGPLLAGEAISELAAHRDWAEVHERYAARFGLDPAPGRAFAEQLRAQQDGAE